MQLLLHAEASSGSAINSPISEAICGLLEAFLDRSVLQESLGPCEPERHFETWDAQSRESDLSINKSIGVDDGAGVICLV